MQDQLNWDDSYAIARSLMAAHPDQDLEAVSLSQIHSWTLQLSDFHDDPQLSNEAILLAIFRDWFEEVNIK